VESRRELLKCGLPIDVASELEFYSFLRRSLFSTFFILLLYRFHWLYILSFFAISHFPLPFAFRCSPSLSLLLFLVLQFSSLSLSLFTSCLPFWLLSCSSFAPVSFIVSRTHPSVVSSIFCRSLTAISAHTNAPFPCLLRLAVPIQTCHHGSRRPLRFG